ncbi:DUF4145 domain-containing protein [Pantoea sp. ACRSB]|uniref:DUF4145 domain-containing protein n=1 Tax=Pantoea sp. ACRSB TaxID=2918207 RepID=UPI0028934BA2|nr:DUF4145 domain-containing protein [Pantoea sp. ACRSB]MCG7388710.1 DUF4145 domain-containing protein [Pantoea sp. ACRSB]
MGILTFDITCPHCLREKAMLEAFAEKAIDNGPFTNVAFFCRSCEQAGICVVRSRRAGIPKPLSKSKENGFVNVVIPGHADYELNQIYPSPQHHSAPDNTPKRAAEFFIESKDNLQRQRYDTAVMICRKVLDIATRQLLGDKSNRETLVQRITMLHAQNLITEQMKDWAHIVRIDSNGAVHSDEIFTKEEAEEIIGFTEVFLIYSFTLPAMVEAKKVSETQ